MSGLITNVQIALRARLLALPGMVPRTQVEWEGTAFTPPTGLPWVRETVKPATSEGASIGPRKRVRDRGLYLVDCFSPELSDLFPARDFADAIVAHFYPGLEVSANGQRVLIRSASRAGVMTNAGWRQIPVTIAYQADTTASA